MRTCELANMRTCEHANMRTCEHANMRTCELANTRSCELANLLCPFCIPLVTLKYFSCVPLVFLRFGVLVGSLGPSHHVSWCAYNEGLPILTITRPFLPRAARYLVLVRDTTHSPPHHHRTTHQTKAVRNSFSAGRPKIRAASLF